MIYGFDILTGIPDDIAFKILGIIQGKLSKRKYNMPVNNPVRSIMINYSFKQYFLWLTVNTGILVSGKETVDIEFIKEPDFPVLDEKFKIYLAEILSKDVADKLPLLREWGIHIMRYGMDIKVANINELMRIFAKTDIPQTHLTPNHAITMLPPYDYPMYGGKLEIYPKFELIKSGRIEYKETKINYTTEGSRDIARLLLVHKRGDMGYVRRIMEKFEMNMWRLDSYLNPLVVTNGFTKAYLDTIGNGDFYKSERALEIIGNKVPNRQNRQVLIELIAAINEKGTILKARELFADKRQFKNGLKLLREAGINGELVDPNSEFNQIKNPVDEIYEKCRTYSS